MRLNHFSEMLVSTTDIGVIVDTAISMLPRLLPGDVQGIIVAGEQGAYLGVAVPFDFTRTERIIQDIQATFAELNEGQVPTELLYTKHLAGNMPVPLEWQAMTVLHLPLLTTHMGILGLIYLASGINETLSDEGWRTFSLVASQISAAVENARLFRQVEQEQARLAAILSSSTDAILVVNRKGRIILDNPAAWSVMGVKKTQRDKLLSESTENEAIIQLFENAIQSGERTGEIPLDDGRTFYANLSPVSASGAGVIGFIATMQDVSHFKELNQLKTDFVNSVSHDLRSPLSGILIATHLMPELGEVNKSQTELLTTIENRVNIMSHLIDDLLDVSKIEAGIDMELAPQILAPLVEQVVTSLIPQAQKKSINLNYHTPSESPMVEANVTRLQQVIHNLVANAIKYTPDEGVVTVQISPYQDEIRIQVIDTGLGIPAADQPHIFEKFYRVKGDHVASIKGTGLGLAIAKGIVEKHKGRIWLESVFGQGSTFTVALPLHKQPQIKNALVV
jgi:PAS domain S-box-containing protein